MHKIGIMLHAMATRKIQLIRDETDFGGGGHN
jgi:hypothetical protein